MFVDDYHCNSALDLIAFSPLFLSLIVQEDPWNSIVSGAATGGILAARAGPKAMASAAVVGGVLLALIEGMGIMFTSMTAPPVPTAEDYQRAMDPTAPPTTGVGGGLLELMSSGGSNAADTATTAPPPTPTEPSFGMETTFTTETTSSQELESSKEGGWFSGWGDGSK